MSIIDLGNIRFNWRGPYAPGINYVKDDVVGYKGSSYVALRNTISVTPVVGLDWELMASGTDQLLQEGDILIHDGTNPIRLPRGIDTQILQLINGRPAWRTQAVDPARRVLKLAKVNGHGGSHIRSYLMADCTIRCVGYGANYNNGDLAGANTLTATRLTTEDPDARFVEVICGGHQSYGLTATGEVWSWGYNNYGQLGHGDTTTRAIAKRIEYFVTNNIQIAKVIPSRANMYDHACVLFLATDGKLYGCGYNADGSCGNGTTATQTTPVRCGALTNIVHVAISGVQHSVYAVQSNGDLWVWGANAYGQLGLGDVTPRQTPILHPSIHNAVKGAVCAGYPATGTPTASGYVLRADGTIWSTGNNSVGQLGLSDTTDRNSFTQIPSAKFFTDIITGDGRYPMAAAITNTGELYTWGYNNYGQCGTGNIVNQSAPFKPSGAFQGQVTKVKIGGGQGAEGCVVQAGNSLWAAGYSLSGNLGIGASNTNTVFTKVYGISGTIQDWGTYGQGTTYWGLSVLYDDGRVDACGYNSYGETGTRSGSAEHQYSLKNVIF